MVEIIKPSKLYDIFEVDKIAVNSFHHQGIKTIGKNFESMMVSEDNILEAIELKSDRFVVGVQWNPETLIREASSIFKIIYFFP